MTKPKPKEVEVMDNLKQTFCKKCGGLKTLKVYGLLVDPMDWWRYDIANDIGCIC